MKTWQSITLAVLISAIIILSIGLFSSRSHKKEYKELTINSKSEAYNIGAAVESAHPQEIIQDQSITDLVDEMALDKLIVQNASPEFQKMVQRAVKNNSKIPELEFW